MQTLLLSVQVVISILLSISVLMQQKGTGLSATFGGQGGFQATKRGAEKFLSTASLVLSILFVLNSIAFLII